MEGPFHYDMLREALNTVRFLVTVKDTAPLVPSLFTDGAMFAYLDLMVAGAIEVLPNMLECHRETNTRQKALKDPAVNLKVKQVSVDKVKVVTAPHHSTQVSDMVVVNPRRSASPTQVSLLEQAMLDLVEEKGQEGLPMGELFRAVESSHMENTAALSMTAMDLVLANKIVVVGSQYPRLVTESHVAHWNRVAISAPVTQDSVADVVTDTDESTVAVESVATKRLVSPVRVWYSLSGAFLPEVFQKCANAVLSCVFLKPDVSKVCVLIVR